MAVLYRCFPTLRQILLVEDIKTLRNGITLRNSVVFCSFQVNKQRKSRDKYNMVASKYVKVRPSLFCPIHATVTLAW
jgi:hypothetical protein